MTAPSERPKTCRSNRRYGRCGLPMGHDGDHAVPIGAGFWFGYRRDGSAVGYYTTETDRGEDW